MTIETAPRLTVAILADLDEGWARTAAAVMESAHRAATPVETLLAWTGVEPPAPGSLALPVKVLFRLGRAYAKNRVLDDAAAPLVAFVEAGLEIPVDWVEAVLRSFGADPQVAMVLGAARRSRGDLGSRPRDRHIIHRLMASLQDSPAANLALRRDTTVAVGGFHIELAAESANDSTEDLDLALRLIASGAAVAVCSAMSGAEGVRPTPRAASAHVAHRIGRITRRHRSLRLCASYVASLPRARPRGALAMLRSFSAGLAARPSAVSPTSVVATMPGGIRACLGGRSLTALPASRPPKTHLMYEAGDDLLLHVYANPSARLRRSVQERESIRSRVVVDGIPALHAAVEGPDELWIVEERLDGTHPAPRDAATWFTLVADWAVQFGGARGPRLETTRKWVAHCDEVLSVCPRAVRSALGDALERVGQLPAMPMHGDFQRRNLLLAGSRVGLVDWEGAWLDGIPGLDLLFLGLLARGDSPDAGVVEGLLAGADPPFGPLSQYLSRIGVSGGALRPALLAMLGTWTLGEARRLARTRATMSPSRPYLELLLALSPRLAA